MANCPNIRSQEWKELVDKVGELQAYGYYVMNDYDIPKDISNLSMDIAAIPKEVYEESISLQELTEKRETLLQTLVNSMNASMAGGASEKATVHQKTLQALINEFSTLDIQKQFVTMYNYLSPRITSIRNRMRTEQNDLELLAQINNFLGSYKLGAELHYLVENFEKHFNTEYLESSEIDDYKELVQNYKILAADVTSMESEYLKYAVECLAKRLGNESTKVRNDYRRKFTQEFLDNNQKSPTESKEEFDTRKQEYVQEKLSDFREEILAGETNYMREALLKNPSDISNLASVITDQRNLKNNILQIAAKLIDDNEQKTNREFIQAQGEVVSVFREFSKARGNSKILLSNQKKMYGDILEKIGEGKEEKTTGYYVRENGISSTYYNSLSEITRKYFELKDAGDNEAAKTLFTEWKKENLTEEAAKIYNLKLGNVTQNQVAEKHRNYQYAKLAKDKTLLEAYNYLRKFNEETDNLVPLKNRLGYKLPSISKEYSEQVRDNGVIKGTTLNMKEGLTFMSNESEYGDLEGKKTKQVATDHEGKPINFINIPYRGKLEEKYQSYDLFGMALTNRYVCLNYANKSLIKVDLEVLRDVLEHKSEVKLKDNNKLVTKTTKNFKKFVGIEEIEKPATKKTINSKLFSTYQEMLQDRLYGEHIKASTFNLGKHEVSLNKIVDNTIGFAAHMTLGFNWKGGIANEINGQMNNFIAGLGGRHFSISDVTQAALNLNETIIDPIMDIGSLRPTSKTGLLTWKFLDSSADINFARNIMSENSRLKRVTNTGVMMAPNTLGESHTRAVTMYAFLNNIKVMKDGKYVNTKGEVVTNRKDAASVDKMYKAVKNKKGEVVDYEFDKNYTIEGFDKFDEKCENYIRRKLKNILADLQGQYDPKVRAMGERVFYAKLFSFLHRWMARTYQRHYRGFGQQLAPEDRFYSEISEETQEGVYTSFSRFLGYISKKISIATYNQFTKTPKEYSMPAREDYENANIRIALWEIGMLLFTGLISSLLAMLGDDEPDKGKKQLIYATAYYTKRMQVELKQLVPWTIPSIAFTTVTSPSALLTNYSKVANFLDQTWNPLDPNKSMFDRYKRGDHKGELKSLVLFRRAFDPTYKVFDFDFKRSYDYMKNGK